MTSQKDIDNFLDSKNIAVVGSTICYAFMQANGMVNDHTTDCFRYKEVMK